MTYFGHSQQSPERFGSISGHLNLAITQFTISLKGYEPKSFRELTKGLG